jgi:hypothetical protein
LLIVLLKLGFFPYNFISGEFLSLGFEGPSPEKTMGFSPGTSNFASSGPLTAKFLGFGDHAGRVNFDSNPEFRQVFLHFTHPTQREGCVSPSFISGGQGFGVQFFVGLSHLDLYISENIS